MGGKSYYEEEKYYQLFCRFLSQACSEIYLYFLFFSFLSLKLINESGKIIVINFIIQLCHS